ncbi:MAG: protein translocase subunit SecD, partial [Bacillota bacterium]|nr:protein translocase subunit SecD [Bacillota bacterium]
MKKKNIFIFFLIIVLTACAYFVSFQGIKIGNFEMRSVRDQLKLGLDIKGGVVVVYEAKTDGNMEAAVNQTINILSRRINQLGLTEPVITKQGENRIRIELPGVDNATEAVKLIGKTAQLEFLLVKPGSFAGTGMKKTDFEYESVMTGENIADAYLSQNAYGNPAVGLSFDGVGAELFKNATQKAKELEAANGRQVQIAIVLDGEVVSAPVVSSVVPDGKGIIDGSFTIETANNLALLIRGGALPVVLEEAYISEVGPTLGLDAFNSAVKAALVGLIAVAVFMLLTYKYPGLIAAVTLSIYALIIIYGMLMFDATLTLPGIAGIVISFGMAVDANVIIFERIKEELANQKSIRASISAGFKRAMSTVVDSNTTTFIAALVLFYFGDGPIKGFAVTLMLGIVASMITAVVITHYLLDLSVGFVKSPALYGSKIQKTKNIGFLSRYKVWFAVSL